MSFLTHSSHTSYLEKISYFVEIFSGSQHLLAARWFFDSPVNRTKNKNRKKARGGYLCSFWREMKSGILQGPKAESQRWEYECLM